VTQKGDLDKKSGINGGGISLDHPGHCGYELDPREPARWEHLKKNLFIGNKLQNFLTY
jgi:hypothetical protein